MLRLAMASKKLLNMLKELNKDMLNKEAITVTRWMKSQKIF